MDKLILKLSTGATLNLNPLKAAKTGNDWWSVTFGGKAPTSFGKTVGPETVGGALPEWVQVTDIKGKALTGKVTLTRGVSMGGHPKVSIDHTFRLGDKDKVLSFNVSHSDKTGFSVNKANVHGKPGSGNRTRPVAKPD